MTNWSRKAAPWIAFAGCMALMLLVAGCGHPATRDESEAAVTGTNAPGVFHSGETVIVTFASPGPTPPPPFDERIKDDGNVNMPLIGLVHAGGMTPGALQKELQTRYEGYYKNITVTVKDVERYYYIDGEVPGRGPKVWLGDTDILQAISAAGGFTDFAKKTNILLIRNGKKNQIINWVKAVSDPRYNVKIYPGDKIYVRRRHW